MRYFIAGDNPITKLLSYDFGKGYVMRDLSGVDWSDIFGEVLDWVANIPVGLDSKYGFFNNYGSSDDVFPYKGVINLSPVSSNKSGSYCASQSDDYNYGFEDGGDISKSSGILRDYDPSSPATQYCKKYDNYSSTGPEDSKLSLSVLKKDGSWDCVYTDYLIRLPISINIEDLKLNYNESEYARGTSGGLRYRLTECKGDYDMVHNHSYYKYNTKYFTRDFTPQKATIKYDRRTCGVRSTQDRGIGIEDWFVDVNIGIADIEGTTKVIVEQLEEGAELPFQYEVEDFRNGYFTANLDRECDTQLTIKCYNENGYARSNTIIVPAVGYSTSQILSLTTFDSYIIINGIPDQYMGDVKMSYIIKSLTSDYENIQPRQLYSNKIDISNLSKGIYCISIYRGNSQFGNIMKFIKK